jgi:phosphate transport system permease protein
MSRSNVPNVSLLGAEGFSLWRIFRMGEPFIWLSGAMVAVVLFMIALMMALVLMEGATFFWPRPVLQVQLKDGSVLAGIQRDAELYEKKDDNGRVLERTPRIQLMVANRDLNSQDFVWIDAPDIVKSSRPPDVLYLERQEWGPLIAWPVSMDLEGKTVAAAEAGFRARFDRAIGEGYRRYKRIKSIERIEIGRVNLAIEDLRLAQKALDSQAKRSGQPVPVAKQAALTAQLDKWQGHFAELQKQLEELRLIDQAQTITFKAVDGQTKTLSLSAIVREHSPNTVGFFGKLGLFIARTYEFIFDEPRESNTEGGVFPAIFGTVMMSLLMSLIVVPFGVIAALYLREYAKQGPLVSAVRVAVNNLAGVPSIVFGVFGLGFFVYFIGGGIDQVFFANRLPTPTYGTGGILWASLTLALLTVPVVVVATEEALAFVPKGIRDGSLACGASKWQMIRTVVLPAAAPGILTGVILAMARGAGEVAPLMITGVVKLAPELPLDGHFPFFHFQRKFMHLGFHIYDVGFQSPNVEAAMPMVYTTTLLLIAVIVGLNVTAMVIRNRLKNRYRTSAF